MRCNLASSGLEPDRGGTTDVFDTRPEGRFADGCRCGAHPAKLLPSHRPQRTHHEQRTRHLHRLGRHRTGRGHLERQDLGRRQGDGERIVATAAAATVKELDAINPDWSLLEWSKYIYVPLGVRVAIPNMARGCSFTCSFCSQWKFWRDYRVRNPVKVVDEIEGVRTGAMDKPVEPVTIESVEIVQD